MRTLVLPPPDPLDDRIAATFSASDVCETRGGHTPAASRTGRPVARVKPRPGTDRVELFCWSRARERWKTFGPSGPMQLEIDDVADSLQNDPVFRIEPKGFFATLLG